MNLMNINEWHDLINKKCYKYGGIVFSSSGSTGKSKSIIYSKKVIKNSKRRLKELLKLTPIKKNSKIVMLWGYGLFPPAYYYTQTFSELGHIVYPLGSGRNYKTELKVREIYNIQPNVIVGMPSYILKICQLLEETGNLEEIKKNIDFVITGGELLDIKIRNQIENYLETQIYDSYGMLQIPMIAGECKYGKLHLSREYYPEVLTENSIENSGNGILLLSRKKFFNGINLKRLLTNDVVNLDNTMCKCGYKTKTITILGRASNTIKVKGQIVDLDALIKSIESSLINDFYIEIKKQPTDEVIIHISNKADEYKLKKIIDEAISFNYKIILEQNFSYIETPTGKLKKIVFNDMR